MPAVGASSNSTADVPGPESSPSGTSATPAGDVSSSDAPSSIVSPASSPVESQSDTALTVSSVSTTSPASETPVSTPATTPEASDSASSPAEVTQSSPEATSVSTLPVTAAVAEVSTSSPVSGSTSQSAVILPASSPASTPAASSQESPSSSISSAVLGSSKPSEPINSPPSTSQVPPAALPPKSSGISLSTSKTAVTAASNGAQKPAVTGSASPPQSASSQSPTLTLIPFTATTVSNGKTITTTGDITSFIAQADNLGPGSLLTVTSGRGIATGTAKVGGADTTGSDLAVTKTHRSGPSSTTVAAIVVSVLGAIALVIAGLFLLRKYLRRRRIATAISPPSSPLLKSSGSLHSNRSVLKEKGFWDAGNLTTSGNGLERYGGGAPLSPLPTLDGLETGFHNGDGMVGGLKLFPSSRSKTEGKELPRDF